jgi:hypothetical protein
LDGTTHKRKVTCKTCLRAIHAKKCNKNSK